MRILHTMLRVGDLERSIAYYTDVLGMALVRRTERPEQKYTLAFMAFPGDPHGPEIELTYNHGVDRYEVGTGYGHIAVATADAAAACAAAHAAAPRCGGRVTREAGPVKGGTSVIAFLEDPDGYKIELIERH